MVLPGNRGEAVDVQSTAKNNWNHHDGVAVTWIIFLDMRGGHLPLFCAISGIG
jgi:hypothetical protein